MSIKRLYILLIFVFGVAVAALPVKRVFAQEKMAINVSASVTSSVELVTLRSMRLSGEDATNEVIHINPTNSPNAGKMVAYGNPNSDIRVSYLPTRELTRLNGTETLSFSYRVAGNQLEEQASAELLNVANRNFSFNEDGEFYLWIGGSVNISTAVPGSYTGEFTLEIEYI